MMKYKKFYVENYRAIRDKLCIDLSSRIVPLVGVNECGKTTILQAIFCFDYINDKTNNGQHLQNTENLYSTVESGDCVVEAEIECKWNDLSLCINDSIEKLERKITTVVAQSNKTPNVAPIDTEAIDATIEWLKNYLAVKRKVETITVSRNITQRKLYSYSLFAELTADDNHLVSTSIVEHLPYILYNDDFNDRPISSIPLGDDKNGGWYDIFSRVFRAANKDYDIAAYYSGQSDQFL